MRDSYNGEVKIGVAVNPQSRLQSMKTARPNLLLLFVLSFESASLARQHEKKLHERFKLFSIGGEWFSKQSDVIEYARCHMKVAKAELKDQFKSPKIKDIRLRRFDY